MYIISGICLLVCVILIYEYRLKRPDQIVLFEKDGKIMIRKSRFYPRHFSLAIPGTAVALRPVYDVSAKGNLDIRVKLIVNIVPSMGNITSLIRTGGWGKDSINKASKDLEMIIFGFVKEFVEKYEIEELSSEKIYNYLIQKISISKESVGLDVISFIVQSFEAIDTKIAEALKQQESARILEQTELLDQKARIAAAKAKIKADEEIAFLENELELKKLDLKKIEEEKESQIAEKRIEDEIRNNKLRLAFEKEELDLIKNSPELLLLTPQAARLAEASQSLKNARTIVSLSPNEVTQGSDLIKIFQEFLQTVMSNYSKTPKQG
jgi:hypothetical protein